VSERFSEMFTRLWREGRCAPLYAGFKTRAGSWTWRPFADALAADPEALRAGRKNNGVVRVTTSEAAIRAWRGGTNRPREAALMAIIDVMLGEDAEARAAMLAAWEAAEPGIELPPEVVEQLDPAGLPFIVTRDALRIDRSPALDDEDAATRPETQHLHRFAREHIEELRALLARRHNMPDYGLSDGWSRFVPAVETLADLLAPETAALPGSMIDIYFAIMGVLGFLDKDNTYRQRPEAGEQPLPGEIRRLLDMAGLSAVALGRAFPSFGQRERDYGETRLPPRLGEAERTAAILRQHGALVREDAATIAAVEALAAGEGPQAEKARRGLWGGMRNAVLSGVVALPLALSSGAYVNESPFLKAAAQALVRIVEEQAPGWIAALPAGVQALVRDGAALMKERLGDGLARPPKRPEEEMEPPAEFDIEEVKRMILAGQAPPRAWVALIRLLNFHRTALQDLTPLSALLALQSLDISATEVCDLAPLANLVALEGLDLTATSIHSLAPLATLTALRTLKLSATTITDISPLRNLTRLETLSLRDTAIEDLSALAGCVALQALTLERSLVRDVSPLRSLTSLVTLDLTNTGVTSVASLAGLNSLRLLVVTGTRIADTGALRDIEGLRIDGV